MTKASAKEVLSAARAVGIQARVQSSGIQREEIVINNKAYNTYNKAINAITNHYIKGNKC